MEINFIKKGALIQGLLIQEHLEAAGRKTLTSGTRFMHIEHRHEDASVPFVGIFWGDLSVPVMLQNINVEMSRRQQKIWVCSSEVMDDVESFISAEEDAEIDEDN